MSDKPYHCPICQERVHLWIDERPACRQHGRFGWFRNLFWKAFGPIYRFGY